MVPYVNRRHRKLQNDGVLDVSDPQQINEVSAFLANPVLAQGLSEKAWDADFLVKLRITPTASLLEGLKKKLMPKADVLALPRTVFGTFDELHDAISEGFLTISGDSYESKFQPAYLRNMRRRKSSLAHIHVHR